MLIGEIEQKSKIRFRIVDDFEIYNKTVDVGYDSEDVIFTGTFFLIEHSSIHHGRQISIW